MSFLQHTSAVLLCCRGCESGYNYSAYCWVHWANWPHLHFNLCTLAHFLHLPASRNGSL